MSDEIKSLKDRLDFMEKEFAILGIKVEATHKAMANIDLRLYKLIENVESIDAYLEWNRFRDRPDKKKKEGE